MAAVDYDAIVIGAGFGGLRMLYELHKMGLKARVFESGTGIGGVRILRPLSLHVAAQQAYANF